MDIDELTDAIRAAVAQFEARRKGGRVFRERYNEQAKGFADTLADAHRRVDRLIVR